MNILSESRCHTCRVTIKLILVLIATYGIPAFSQQRAPAVIVGMAKQISLIEEVPLSGTVASKRIAKLSTEVSGLVESMNVDIGDTVQAGDEILRLNSELEALSLTAAQAATKQAIEELKDAKRRLADAKALAKRHTVSVNEQKSLAAEVRIDSAGVERLKAAQQRQAAQLRRYKLNAPFAGVISRKLAEQGEWLKPGDQVVELIATTDLVVELKAPQAVYGKLEQTTNILIRLDAMPGQAYEARLDTVIPISDPATRTFMIRAVLNDSSIKLAPGMSASAVLRLNTGSQGVVVDRDALLRYPDGRITVWVVKGEGDQTTVSEQQVKTGLSFNGKVAIRSGLAPNTLVVVRGNEALREGQKVTIQAHQ